MLHCTVRGGHRSSTICCDDVFDEMCHGCVHERDHNVARHEPRRMLSATAVVLMMMVMTHVEVPEELNARVEASF